MSVAPASKTARRNSAATPAPVRPAPEALDLVLYPAPVLKRRAADVAVFDEWLQAVVVRMKQMMVEHKGVGLAAPQVGVGLRLFIWSPEGRAEEAQVFVNPVLSEESGEQEGEEGCLSLPDIRINVVRFAHIHVEAFDQFGQPVVADLDDYPARIVQHENDHLEGILLTNRMGTVAKLAHRKKLKELEEKMGK
jgi:peptide deformylase